MLSMEMKTQRGLSGPQLYWVGIGCLALAVMAFVSSFSVGNTLDPRGAMFLLVIGLIVSIIASIVAAVLSVAGLVAFAHLRGRFSILLLLSLVFSPLLWLGLMAALL